MKHPGMPRERARRIRLALRDGAAAAAFGAMALSGQVPIWVCALFLLGAILAFLGHRPLAALPGSSTALLFLAATGLAALFFLGQMDPIIAASSFAGLLTLQRMLSAAEPKTDQQVHLASLLMLAGGAALSGDLLFGGALLLFAMLGSLSLGLGVVEAAVPDGELVPVRAVVWPLARGVMFALVGALAFFVLFPRMSWNMATRGSSSALGQATTGFTDRVRLGDGQGTLKTNPRVVARVTLAPDPDVDALNAYWVGRTFDNFDGQEWSVSVKERRAVGYVGGVGRYPPASRIQQKIELLPAYDGRTIVGLEPVIAFRNPRLATQGGPAPGRFEMLGGNEVRFADSSPSGYFYEAFSTSEEFRPEELTEEERQRELTLPASLDPRIAELAERVVGEETRPLEVARKLEGWLKREYTYSLELSGDVPDPLPHFLFERKEGHCEHFASALTILLRTRGIPARLASGFFGGERVGEHFVLRAGDAHAWTQVHVSGRGWITVDATPESFRLGQPQELFAWAVSAYEWLDQQWRSSVLDYDLRTQWDGVRTLVRPPRTADVKTPSNVPPARAWLVAALVGLAVYLAWRFSRRAERARPHPAAKLHDALEKILSDAGLTERGQEPLEEVASRLKSTSHPLGPTVDRVTRRYLEARFGGQPLDEGEAAHLAKTLDRAVKQHGQARPGRT